MRDALLIYNPTSGRRRHRGRLGALVAALGAGGWRAEPAATIARGDATRLAAAAAAGGAEAVFVYAGDGTVREAAAGLLGGSIPLGILPGGTANVLAHALGLPRRPLAAARAHARSERRLFDVGRCGATPFLMMASAGLDAAVIARLQPALKTWLGRTGVLLQGLGEWWRYPYPPLTLTSDGHALPPATFAAVCNIPFYAGRFALAPAARWDDRRLDLVAFHGSGPRATLGFALALATGRHLARGDVVTTAAEEIVLDGPPGLCLQVDGDVCVEPLPATVRLAQERLPVLVPSPLDETRLYRRAVHAKLPSDRMSDTRSEDQTQAALQMLMSGLGLSNLEAAEMLGVTTDTISRWENGSIAIPPKNASEILAAKANVRRLQTMLRPELLPATVRRPADFFAGDCALQWILRGRIAEVVDRYESTLRYQA